jgi:hypothetical protein
MSKNFSHKKYFIYYSLFIIYNMSVRSAVGLTNNNTQLGEQVTTELASTTPIPTGAQTGSVCQITLDAGVWVIEGRVACGVGASTNFSNGYSEFYIQDLTTSGFLSQASATSKTTGEIFNGSSNIFLNMSATVNITSQTSYVIFYDTNYTAGSFELATDGSGSGASTILSATRVA